MIILNMWTSPDKIALFADNNILFMFFYGQTFSHCYTIDVAMMKNTKAVQL